MAQEYLPAPSNIRLADLMKEHNISQPELAKELGCSKSTINRFISGAQGTLTHEQILKIARLFNVSTDFLLGETNIPDRKNYDIAELGLSVEAAKNLYTGRVNTEVVNLLLENARFAELTYRIAQYFDDTFASGIAAQNAMLTTLSTLLRTKVKTPEAAKAAKDISLRRKPVYQGDLDDIEMYFMATVKEIKKGIGSHYEGHREPLRRTGSHEQESGRENVHRIDQRAGCAAPNDHGRAVDGCHAGQRFGHGRSHVGSTGTAAKRSAGNLAVCRRAGKRP